MGLVIHIESGENPLIPKSRTVNQFSDLPDANLKEGEYWLVDEVQGSNWTLNRKDPGIYKAVSGSWSYRGPDVPAYFRDDQLLFSDDAGPGELTFTLDGLTARRNAAWQNKDGLIALQPSNDVDVESLSDFPTPVGGFITPADKTTYRIHGFVDIGANGFDFTGVNAKIEGTFTGSDGIISSTAGNFIKGNTTFGASFEKLRLTALTCDKFFNIIGTGIESFVYDSCIAIGGAGSAIGDFDTMSVVLLQESSFQGFGDGVLFLGAGNILLINNVQSINTLGTFIDLGTSTFGGIEISSSTIFSTAGNIGLAIAPLGANVNVGGRGLITGVGVSGGGTPITGYSPLDLAWNVYGNNGIITSDRITPTGWGNYDDNGVIPFVITTTPTLLPINGLGVFQETAFLPSAIRGIDELYVSPAITPIVEGDSYDVAMSLLVTAKTGGVTEFRIEIDEGVGAAPTAVQFFADFSVGKTPPFPLVRSIVVTASANMIANGGRLFISCDSATVTVSVRSVLISRNSSGAS